MGASFFTTQRDAILAAASAHFVTKIVAQPTLYGLNAAQAAAYSVLNTAYQTAYAASTDPSTRTKSAVTNRRSARTPLCQMASDLAKIIQATPSVTPGMKDDLGISVRATPAPRPAPGTPYKFGIQLANNGGLTTTWKCENPRGATGTIYQVWRKIGAGAWTYLGGSGEKRFVDQTIPAGTAGATYQVQAVRSTVVGEFGEFNVNFAMGSVTPVVEEVVATRKAA